MVGNPSRGEPVKLVELCLCVVFRSVVHLDPIEQIFLDPVTAHVGILLVDARDGLNDIEPFGIGPDELAFPGVELHVLHHIAEGVGELSKLLALRRMPPSRRSSKKRLPAKILSCSCCGCWLRRLPMRFPSPSPSRAAPV